MQTIILGLIIGGVYFDTDKRTEYIVTQGTNQIAGVDFYTLTGLLFFLSISGMMSSLSPVAIVFPK